MKTLIIFCTTILLPLTGAFAQTLNWHNIDGVKKNLVSVNAGWDYANTIGLAYTRVVMTKMPIALSGQFSKPAGNDLLDDFKSKLGGQIRLITAGNFAVAASVYGNYRQYQSSMAKLQSFGCELTAIGGYYRAHWFLAMEFGFDKAIATRIRGSDWMKQNFPSSKDGWYVPTAGNFLFALQAGGSIKNVDLFLRAGQVTDQNFKSSAQVPFMAQVGVNVKF
ncbi:MAG: hypothetical protein JST14_07395 [Bacteroidetes bacterium]|nr:hypothetical protein [Bacteroidota bacterium]